MRTMKRLGGGGRMYIHTRQQTFIRHRYTIRTLAAIFVIVALATGILAVFHRVDATPQSGAPLTFSLYATHPYASQAGFDNTSTNYYTGQQLCPPPQTFCPSGQTILDMEVTGDGKLIAGYGDWNSNVDSFGVAAGRIGVVPLDLGTGFWGSPFYAGSESLDTIRKVNGFIYAPTTDPSDKAATGNPTGNYSGYITNQTGSWTFVRDSIPSAIHTHDVATLNGADLWTFNSSNGNQAEARRSTDGGTTFTSQQTQTGYWYMWGATINDRLYVKSENSLTVARSFDGTTWRDEPSVTGCLATTTTTRLVVVFDNQIVCGNGSGIQSYNGTTVTTHAAGLQVRDFAVHGGYLYALTAMGIFRTDSLANPLEVFSGATVPGDARSIAAYGDTLYLGGASGKVYRADLTISASKVSAPTMENCFAFNSGTGAITGYGGVGCGTDVVVPESINGVAVTAIGANAFYNKGLTSVLITGSVASIGGNAFMQNTQLQSISIPNSVTSIANGAFSGCPLTTVSIDMPSIPAYLFQTTNTINHLTLGDSVTSIGDYAFSHNDLTSITIPNSVVTIGAYSFVSNALTNVDLGTSVVSIGTGAFGSNQLTSVIIPDSVINLSGFYYNQLTSVTIPNSVTTIGQSAFLGNQLVSVNLGNSVTTIDGGAFAFNQLTSIDIPESVTTIEHAAFGTNQLASVIIPDSVVNLGGFNNNLITSVTIPNSVQNLIAGTFAYNRLTSVTIPESVTTINNSAFDSNQLASIVIPATVTTIGQSAFASNQLTSLIIPDSVTSIGTYAFYGNQITNLTIGSGVTTIGGSAFQYSPIQTLALDMAVISNGNLTFGTAISSLTLGPHVTTVGTNAFLNNKITSLIIGDSVTTIGSSAFRGNKLTNLVIGDSVTTIGSSAFSSNQLASVTIPNSVTTIGSSAFSTNPLAALEIDMTSIPANNVFGTAITALTLGSNVVSIGDAAFANTKMTEITVPASVQTVGNRAFQNAPIELMYMNGTPTLGIDAFTFGNQLAVLEGYFAACYTAMTPPAQVLADYIPCYNQAVAQTKQAASNSFFARLYTPHPHHYANKIAIVQETTYSGLLGVPAPILPGGGVLVNPVAIYLTHKNSNGGEVAPSTTKVGPQLTNYSLASAYALKPDLTDADLATMYYHGGDTVTVMPPAIDGYQTPLAFNGVLSAPTTTINFLYTLLGAGKPMAPRVTTGATLPVSLVDTSEEGANDVTPPHATDEEIAALKEKLSSLPKDSDKSFGAVLGEWFASNPLVVPATAVGAPVAWWLIATTVRRRKNKEDKGI